MNGNGINQDSIIDVDDYLATIENEDVTKTILKKKTSIQEPKEKKSEKKEIPLNELGRASDALLRHANEKLRIYLKRSPQYKILEHQLTQLSEEYKKYKLLGEEDLCEKTRQMLVELTMNKNKFVKLYKNDFKVDKEKAKEKINASPLLKELKQKREILENQFKMMNPSSLVTMMKEFRKNFEISNKISPSDENILDFDDENFDELLSEELQNSSKSNLKQDYENLCGQIGKLIDEIPSRVDQMSISEIYNELKNNVDLNKLESLKAGIETIKIEASTEMAKLNGKEDITNIIFEIFDLETEAEEKPKEMLAASNVGYVKSIAYGQCLKMNMLHYIDDAVAYGLMGLSVAIDKWYKIQKLKDSVVSFNGFAHTYILMNVKKGLYELGSGGVLNKNSIATLQSNRKKQLESFIKLNPEFKDMPSDMVESMLDGLIDDKPVSVITEGTYTDIVGGEGEQNADIWSNATVASDDEKFIECKLEYENLIKSIKKLFSLFETKVDSETGLTALTKFKVFDKFDYKLFKLCYGLEFKREFLNDNKTVVNNVYNQSEIGEALSAYYAKFGVTKTFSQAAINYRITELNRKIKEQLDFNPGLKAGFEYIYNYFQTNSEAMNYLSNSREEMDIKMDREQLSTRYANNQDEMNKLLSDGKRLSDIYELGDSNPLDSQISEMFRNF
jgi:hypothetical protein